MGMPSLIECVRAADQAMPALLDLAVRSLAIVGAAGVMAAGLGRASAAVRHWVWLMGFAGLLLLPMLAAVLPAWRVVPRVWERARVMPMMVVPAAPVAIDSPAQAVVPNIAVNEEPVATTGDLVPPVTAAAQPAAAEVKTAAVPANSPAAISAASIPPVVVPWTAWTVAIWMAGCLAALGHVTLGHLSLWWLRRHCTRLCDGEWESLLRELQRTLKVRRPVELLSSPIRTMPMTWGLWRTRLLVPVQAEHWPMEQRRAVLLHELGHVRRWDCVTQLVAQLACAVYWFNPLVWVGWRRMQIERERACDDFVLGTGTKGSAYAQHLLQSATAMPVRFVGAAVAMARPSTLEERLQAILDNKRSRRSMTMKSVLGPALMVTMVVVPMACLKAQETAPPGSAVRTIPVTPETPPTAAFPGETPPVMPTPAPVTQAMPDADPNLVRPPATAVPTRPGTVTNGAPTANNTTRSLVPPRTTPVPAEPTPGTLLGRGGRNVVSGGGRGGNTNFGGGFFYANTAIAGATATFDATIYDVRVAPDQIGRLDVNELTHAAANVGDFEAVLGRLGTIMPLCRVSQSVRLEQDTLKVGTQTPYPQSSNNGSWVQTGSAFSIASKSSSSNKIDLNLEIQVSAISESAAAAQDNMKAPVLRNSSMSYKGPVVPREPFVVLSVDAGTKDGNGKAVAYIARITLGQPQGTVSQGETVNGVLVPARRE